MPEIPQRPPRRVFFYVDGFNLYYRRLERAPHLKWLCLRTLASKYLFPNDTIEKVKFFTAEVDATQATDRQTPKRRRQQAYWQALRTTGVEIVQGVLEMGPKRCKAAECGRFLEFTEPREKMSDVNLALHLFRDYLEGEPDIICTLSGDCDVLPAFKMVREYADKTGKKVMRVIYLPSEDDGLLFSRLPHHYQIARTARLGESMLRLSQFPDKVQISATEFCERPDVWR